jgi:3-dehydroquinate synthase
MHSLSYNKTKISIGDLAVSQFDALLQSARYKDVKKVIITDENVFDLWMEYFITTYEGLAEAEIIQLPAGEDNKVLEICAHIWNALSEYEINRNDLIINIGGGVITDMGGFIAGTYKRGLNFINIPTTLLSQVDASMGGKTGIDLGAHKNQIGLFNDPEYVFIDPHLLSTLAQPEKLSGFAEMLKHGLISSRKHWDDLKRISLDSLPTNFDELILQSVSIKKEIVLKDPMEANLRKLLNFGHTVGHAIEGFYLSLNTPIPHGFAIAWGMLAEAHLSLQKNLLSQVEFDEINTFIRGVYAPLHINQEHFAMLLQLMKNDKKNRDGNINFTLLKRIGEGLIDCGVTDNELNEALLVTLNSPV